MPLREEREYTPGQGPVDPDQTPLPIGRVAYPPAPAVAHRTLVEGNREVEPQTHLGVLMEIRDLLIEIRDKLA